MIPVYLLYLLTYLDEVVERDLDEIWLGEVLRACKMVAVSS